MYGMSDTLKTGFLLIFLYFLFFRSVLEYDSEMFTKISFLFEWNDFYFIIIGKFVNSNLFDTRKIG